LPSEEAGQNVSQKEAVERQKLAVDIACVGFGPAMGGFLTTLARETVAEDGTVKIPSVAAPGMPLQVVCYERADDIGFGVSGVVTRGRGIKASFPGFEPSQVPLAAAVSSEKTVYLLDPVGASRRSLGLRAVDRAIRTLKFPFKYAREAVELPYTPEFLRKHDGWVMSVGQFNQWVGAQLMGSGAVQIWPGMPVEQALVEGGRVRGLRLVDQGTDRAGAPEAGYMPGMDVEAPLTVVGDGPVGPVGRQLDEEFGMPGGHHVREWAVGMKFVIELRENVEIKPGTVLHTFGYPEPEIFGFLYVLDQRLCTVGIFVPSWLGSPVRTSYRYLQHYIQHPYLWRYLEGGKLRSWGAKSLQESGKRGEPFLAGDGYARIGEGSGSTNVLTGSGVDEAWTTGTQLAEAVIELLRAGRPFTKQNLEATYVKRRRGSWVEKEGRIAECARDGFQGGLIEGMFGMALAGLTRGMVVLRAEPPVPQGLIQKAEKYFAGRIAPDELEKIKADCAARGVALHDAIMDRLGWPAIPFDGTLLVSQQDALLMGGKVQAPAGFADHVRFRDVEICRECGARVCVEICSAQAITPGADGVPQFDREKCVHCGACLWNCSQEVGPGEGNIEFRAGAGGLHSAEN